MIRRLKPGAIKALAALMRASWIDHDTRRRVCMASNRQIAELAAVADPETIGRHIRTLAEAGLVTIDHHEGRRRLILPEVKPGEFVTIDDSDSAWSLNPAPFAALLAVRWFDWSGRGQSWPTDATLAKLLAWSVQSVSRAMAKLRQAGAVGTSSRYDAGRQSRRRVITITTRKSDEHPPGKVMSTHPEKRLAPTRKSDELNHNSEPKLEPPPRTKAGAVVVESITHPPRAETPPPPELAEVVALLAKSKLSPAEQGRYLSVSRNLAGSSAPPPVAWHRHALDVQPSRGTLSLAAVTISRLKAWETTPPDRRAVVMRDTSALAEALRQAETDYRHRLMLLRSNGISAAEVRQSWQRFNAAAAAAGQAVVMLDAAVIRAEFEAGRFAS